MPGSCDSDQSPSLISSVSLRQFRFQNQRSRAAAATIITLPTTPKQENNSPPTSTFSSPRSIECLVIPETPESQRLNSRKQSNEVSPSTSSTTQESADSAPLKCRKKVLGFQHKIPVVPDSEIPHVTPQISAVPEMAQNDFLDKEMKLRELLKRHPKIDPMEAQDLLVNTSWNLDQAIETYKKTQEKKNKYQDPFSEFTITNDGIYIDPQRNSTDNNNDTPNHKTAEEIVIDSDNEEKPKFVTLSNGLYYAKDKDLSDEIQNSCENHRKKRRRIICHDDDSDDCSPSQSTVTVSAKKESENAFSVLKFKPKPSGPIIVFPTDNNRTIPPSKFFPSNRPSTSHMTYSRNRIQNVNGFRVVDSSVFTNDDGALTSAVARKKHSRKRKDVSDDEGIDEEYGNNDVYDSEDSDSETRQRITPARKAVLQFMQTATSEELIGIPGCSKKKVEAVLKCRPFEGWAEMVYKLNSDKSLSADLLNGAKKVLDTRTAVNRIMTKCQKISMEMEYMVEALKSNRETKDYISKQPEILSKHMHLTPYQMLGLNWLNLIDTKEVNGILADEMGLGKTIQAIAFLGHLKETGNEDPHLIVVPSSTLDNWFIEFEAWWPSAKVLSYHGSQEYRREIRMDILDEDEDFKFDIILTTYNMVTSSPEDRSFFKKLHFHYVVFDEAHMLKNMATQRYQNLMRIKASRRLLLTGTPLQNNLIELMSLLIFAVPDMFFGKTEHIKQMFTAVCKSDEGRSTFEREQIERAKKIMKPFVLRRLKTEVLKDLPLKHEEVKFCEMYTDQKEDYMNLVVKLSEEVASNKEKEIAGSGAGMMMQLRKAANHPLLLRKLYDDSKLFEMSRLMLKEPTHAGKDPQYILEDMLIMSDFELHRLCQKYDALSTHILDDEEVLASGKFKSLDVLIPNFIEQDRRILLFSQFTMVLDIVEEYMNIREYQYIRLDGQVPVPERQQLIDEFNKNPDITVFLLSTRAGGLGINLTAASAVLIHDIDFNPYNDKQAEDRCHRVGQIRDVTVIRMISKDTIEEGMLARAKEKLKLEEDVTTSKNNEEADTASVATLLRDALGLTKSGTL